MPFIEGGRNMFFLRESCLEPQHNIPQHVLSHGFTTFVENRIKGFPNQHEYQFLRTFKLDALLVTDPYSSKELEFQMNFFKTKFIILISSLSET